MNLQDPCLVSYCAAFLFTFFLLARVSNIVPRSRSRVHASFCFRRSDIVFTTDGLLVTFHRTKTIQFGRRRLSLPLLLMPGSPIRPVRMFSLMCSLVHAPSDSPAFVSPDAGGKLVPIVKSQFVSVFPYLLQQELSALQCDNSGADQHRPEAKATPAPFLVLDDLRKASNLSRKVDKKLSTLGLTAVGPSCSSGEEDEHSSHGEESDTIRKQRGKLGVSKTASLWRLSEIHFL